MTVDPYPLVLQPLLKPKVWGGRRLQSLGKSMPDDGPIGESWELADLGSTNASGGGGDAARSTIANGPLAGTTLHDAMDLWGHDMMGDAQPTPSGDFPLLVKYLDAREHLSLQVHPSPEFAAVHPGAHLKTESWYIVDAEPGSELFVGFQTGVTRDDLEAAIRSGTVPSIMRSIPAIPGECHTLPSGTVHALGAGVLVAEVQTPSDTTFRVYDWTNEYDRPDRELHIEQALACASFEMPPTPIATEGARTQVSATEFYRVTSIKAHCEAVDLPSSAGPLVVMLPQTMGAALASRSGSFEEVSLGQGQTSVIPASITDDVVLRAGPNTLAVTSSAT
ncbi:MAG: type I phosphomannose isomerase catalytic subunit [Phycisphaerales bacterium]